MLKRPTIAAAAMSLAGALLAGSLLVGPSAPAAAQTGATATPTAADTTASPAVTTTITRTATAGSPTAAATTAATRTAAPTTAATTAATRTAAPTAAATTATTRTAAPTAQTGTTTAVAQPSPTQAPTATAVVFTSTQILTLNAARLIAAAAEAEAASNGWAVTIAIVDASGDLLLLERLDGAAPASVDLASGKARTAARFQLATETIADNLAGGGVVAVEGGLPITVDGKVVGAIGVAGAPTPAQDGDVASAGLAALAP